MNKVNFLISDVKKTIRKKNKNIQTIMNHTNKDHKKKINNFYTVTRQYTVGYSYLNMGSFIGGFKKGMSAQGTSAILSGSNKVWTVLDNNTGKIEFLTNKELFNTYEDNLKQDFKNITMAKLSKSKTFIKKNANITVKDTRGVKFQNKILYRTRDLTDTFKNEYNIREKTEQPPQQEQQDEGTPIVEEMPETEEKQKPDTVTFHE